MENDVKKVNGTATAKTTNAVEKEKNVKQNRANLSSKLNKENLILHDEKMLEVFKTKFSDLVEGGEIEKLKYCPARVTVLMNMDTRNNNRYRFVLSLLLADDVCVEKHLSDDEFDLVKMYNPQMIVDATNDKNSPFQNFKSKESKLFVPVKFFVKEYKDKRKTDGSTYYSFCYYAYITSSVTAGNRMRTFTENGERVRKSVAIPLTNQQLEKIAVHNLKHNESKVMFVYVPTNAVSEESDFDDVFEEVYSVTSDNF